MPFNAFIVFLTDYKFYKLFFVIILMEVEIIEKDKDKLKIRLDDLTFANMINEKIWEEKVKYSAFKVEHPYLSYPEIIVRAENPEKIVIVAAEKIAADVKSLKSKL